MSKAVDVRGIRERLGLSQPQFCEQFGFNITTLRQWEQGRRTPDLAAQSFLRVIALHPETVSGALKTAS